MFHKLSFKLFLGLLFGALCPFFALSQDEGVVCAGVTHVSAGNAPIGGNCMNPTEGIKFYEKNNFIPHNPDITPIKTIRMAITCIYNPTDTPGTPERGFDGSLGQKEWFEEVFRRVNVIFSDSPPPSDPIVSEHIPDTRIRFVLEKIQFVPALQLVHMTGGAGALLNNPIYSYKRDEIINVIANLGTNGSATAEAFVDWSYVLTSRPYAQMYKSVYEKYLEVGKCYLTPDVANYSDDCVTQTDVVAITFSHELGHLLGLRHTYIGVNDGAAAYCGTDINNEDYYFDLIGTPTDNIQCPHSGGWDTNPAGPNSATNNLMGGTSSAKYLSPQQQGMMHRYLCNSSMRKYVQGSPYSAVPDPTFVVSGNETWTSNIRVYNDAIVKPGATLTIQCEVQFSNGGHIYVEPGALVLDGGLLSCFHSGLWKGIEAWSAPDVNGNIRFGRVIMTNGAIIEHAEIGVLLGKRAATGGIDAHVTAGFLKANGASIIRNCLNGAYFTRAYTGTGSLPSTITDGLFSRDANHRFNSPFGTLAFAYHVRGTQGADKVSVTNT